MGGWTKTVMENILPPESPPFRRGGSNPPVGILPGTGPLIPSMGSPMSIKTESPLSVDSGLPYKIRHRPTLPPVTAIPSALAGLTSLFGMGRGGHRRYRHLNTFLYMTLLGQRTLTCYWKKRSEKERGQQVYPHWKASGY